MAKATKEAKIIDAEPVNGTSGASGGAAQDAGALTGRGSGLALVLSGVALLISLVALGLNLVPILLFMLACYYTDSKFQLAFAKLLTLLYMMIMLAVYVGLLIQIFDEGRQF